MPPSQRANASKRIQRTARQPVWYPDSDRKYTGVSLVCRVRLIGEYAFRIRKKIIDLQRRKIDTCCSTTQISFSLESYLLLTICKSHHSTPWSFTTQSLQLQLSLHLLQMALLLGADIPRLLLRQTRFNGSLLLLLPFNNNRDLEFPRILHLHDTMTLHFPWIW